MKKNENTVYVLSAYNRDGDSETFGVYGTTRALVAGLAEAIYKDHVALRDAKPEEIAKIVALAVFDFVSVFGFKSDRPECRGGDTGFGCREYNVQFLDDRKEGDNA